MAERRSVRGALAWSTRVVLLVAGMLAITVVPEVVSVLQRPEALGNLAMHARIAICGFIATDYAPGPNYGPINYKHLLYKRARMEGFVVFDYWDRYEEAERDLLSWHQQGLLKDTADIDEGLENMPAALASLFTGGNTGARILRVSPDPEILPGESSQ